jgi:hypothetical protein
MMFHLETIFGVMRFRMEHFEEVVDFGGGLSV